MGRELDARSVGPIFLFFTERSGAIGIDRYAGSGEDNQVCTYSYSVWLSEKVIDYDDELEIPASYEYVRTSKSLLPVLQE